MRRGGGIAVDAVARTSTLFAGTTTASATVSVSSWRFSTASGRVSRRALASTSSSSSTAGRKEGEDGVDMRVGAFAVWGANTGVGKTLTSGGLAAAARARGLGTLFLKPVQTGFPEDSDAGFVARVGNGKESMGEHAAVAANASATTPEYDGTEGTWAHTTYAWKLAAGPHVSAGKEGRPVMDEEIVRTTRAALGEFSQSMERAKKRALALVETAGGVASPAPSGRLQCDVLRALRLPAILVGDGKLGGISTTAAAYEALRARGYDVVAVAMADDGLANHEAMAKIVESGTPVAVLPALPPEGEADPWLERAKPVFDDILNKIMAWHEKRIQTLKNLPDEAMEKIWWPFTQHAMVDRDAVTVIDGRYGEDFAIYGQDPKGGDGSISLRFDGAASWWTQGLSPELQQELVQTATYAAGRYGHVMFPENVHEPASEATSALLEGPGRGWASRVFYSDNGSTATEVGLKMAFRKYYVDAGLVSKDGNQRAKDLVNKGADDLPPLRIMALDGSYHGDTLGAMDMQSPSVFTGPMQTPWYQPRGLFLQPPSLAIRHGKWTVALPFEGLLNDGKRLFEGVSDLEAHTSWDSREAAFDMSQRQDTELAKEYRKAIDQVLERAKADAKAGNMPRVGALIMEPVLHGAGGMVLIDPLFQNILMKACRENGIPIVLDEVFAGIWRLGTEGAWEIIGEKPDISCYAKLLTGGLMPMSATLATSDVFAAFHGPGKAQGLLHGHSYTAYPMGCAVAAKALEMYKSPAKNPNLVEKKPKKKSSSSVSPTLELRELWDESKLRKISMMSNVRRVIGQGCVLAVELEVEGEGGYSSNAAREVVMRLRPHGIQARPLGNVVYLMCAPTTSKDKCDGLLDSLTIELSKH